MVNPEGESKLEKMGLHNLQAAFVGAMFVRRP